MMFLRHALRHRAWQAGVLFGVSVLISGCTAFGPWFSRAVEQAVTANTLADRRIEATWTLSSDAVPPESLDRVVPIGIVGLFEPFVHQFVTPVVWPSAKSGEPVGGRLVWRQDACRQIVMVSGHCPRAAGDVLVSIADQHNFGVVLGATLRTKALALSATGGGLRVVGLYRVPKPSAPYWFGVPAVGRSYPFPTKDRPAQSDYLITARETFERGRWGQTSTAETAPVPGVARLDDMTELRRETERLMAEAPTWATLRSGLPFVHDQISADRRQARIIIPLVLAQEAVFGLVVLALAAAAVIDQRRPEIAVGRLRGMTPREAARSTAAEVAVPVLVGGLVGPPAALAVLTVVRQTWLAGLAPAELPWQVPAAIVGAALAGLAVLVLTVRPVVRQPVGALLRTVAPRRRGWTASLVDVTVIVVAGAGLLASITGDGRGPLAILTPTLLSLAVGLGLAHLLLPLAGWASGRALRRGWLAFGLGALQVARRPSVTRIVAVVAVATALVSFAGQASSVAGRNRDTRAGFEVGAEQILELTTDDVQAVLRAVDGIDPERHLLTPVVTVRPPSPDALTTMLIEPDSFRRIAYGAEGLTDTTGFGRLRAPAVAGPLVRGRRLSATVTTRAARYVSQPGGGSGNRPQAAKTVDLLVTLVRADGQRSVNRLGPVPLTSGRTVTVSTAIGCAQPCRLLRIGVGRDASATAGFDTRLELGVLRTDAQVRIALGTPGDWSELESKQLDTESLAAEPAPGSGIGLQLVSLGTEQHLQHRSAPAVVPILATPDTQLGGGTTVPGIDGQEVLVTSAGRTLTPVPRYLHHTAIADLDSVLRRGGSVDAQPTVIEVWLNSEGAARSGEIVAALQAARTPVASTDRMADRAVRYARSASALALRLTPVVGAAAWSLAIIVLLLMVVTSWRPRSEDYASLRMAGLGDTTVTRAARWEQAVPVALATVLGSACGMGGAALALPMIPLFAVTEDAIPVDLGLDWPTATATWLVSMALLLGTTLALAFGVTRRATYDRIREDG